MSQQRAAFPKRFLAAVQAIERLEPYDRYLGAFIFGSLARHEASEQSDCDVQVIVNEDNPCTNINHPLIEGVKLDLTFLSLGQLKARTQREIERRERPPLIAEALMVFDKTNQLSYLQEQAKQAQPMKTRPEELQSLQFMFFHGNEKAERNLEADPLTALLVMHVGLNEFLKYHYQMHQQWWVSSKRLLPDLRRWDLPLAQLVEQFVTTCEVRTKFAYWSAIIDHILEPVGGRQPMTENNCRCSVCQHDLSMLFSQNQEMHTP
ncbi:MAG TPA: nucleotidyltransferase domain-containing protein [Ktedonobacteraceae bacterium]|nr:nucleotidyltransferase domain-containing protein [Ktedonobacteraceae bacterium]